MLNESLTMSLTPLESKDIYISKNLHVAIQIFDRTQPVCIAFASGGQPQVMVGMHISDKYGLNWVSVASCGQDWFQYPDLDAALKAIVEFISSFPRIILYGYSMGAYGALISSKTLAPDVILAFSPQAAIGENIPSRETRWQNERARIQNQLGFPNDHLSERLTTDGEVFVIYDPMDDDKLHVQMIDSIRSTKKIFFPLASHGTLPIMARMGLASRIICEVMSNSFDQVKFQHDLLKIRKETYQAELLFAKMNRSGRKIPAWILKKLIDNPIKTEYYQIRAAMHIAIKLNEPELAVGAFNRLIKDASYLAPTRVIEDTRSIIQIASKIPHQKLLKPLEGLIATSAETQSERSRQLSLLVAAAYINYAQDKQRQALEILMGAARKLTAWEKENVLIAEALDSFGYNELAKQYHKRAELLEEVDYVSFEKRARTFEREQNWQAAAMVWAEAADLKIDTLKVAIRYAQALSRAGKLEEALNALSPILNQPIVSPEVRKLQANCAMKIGRYEEAITAFKEVVKIYPENSIYHRSLSNAYYAIGSLPEARHHAHVANLLQPTPGNQRHLDKVQIQLTSQLQTES